MLSELPESNLHFQAILSAYKKMMETLLENQSEDGMWHQLIDNSESFKETSSTAMFVITSYSIHYTKLYEKVSPSDRRISAVFPAIK